MQGTPKPAAVPRNASGERRVKILLVDEVPENLASLRKVLDGLGEDLVLAHSGTEALRHSLEDDFAAILLDVGTPDMHGFETARRLRGFPRSRGTPILFLTRHRNKEHLCRGYALGSADFLFKPIVADAIRSKVAAFAEISRNAAKQREELEAVRAQAGQLERTERQTRSVLDAAPEAMVACREDGEILMVNAQAEALFHCTRKHLIGRNIRERVPGWACPFRPGWHDAAGASKPPPVERGIELQATPEGGAPFQAEFSFGPLLTSDGLVVTCCIRDISARKHSEELVRQWNTGLEMRILERTEALLRSNEELQQFAYVASHDLQEPLRTVSVYAQLLAKRYGGQLSGDADLFIKFIVDGSERMDRLIHALLDFSRLDMSGAEAFTHASCEDALTDALANIAPLIAENHAAVTHGPLPVINGDPVQLTRLFQNLLLNSIRFRSDAAPCIQVAAQRQGGEWRFSVSDNGIGIEPQYAEKVFGIFRCLEPRDKGSGNGMGLAICRKIVTRHGGRIWVESELGAGACFYFTLPGIRVPSG